jgi:hypothetical protein
VYRGTTEAATEPREALFGSRRTHRKLYGLVITARRDLEDAHAASMKVLVPSVFAVVVPLVGLVHDRDAATDLCKVLGQPADSADLPRLFLVEDLVATDGARWIRA